MTKDALKETEKMIYSEILSALEDATDAEYGESEMADSKLPHAVLEVAARSATLSVMAYIRGTEAMRTTGAFIAMRENPDEE